MRNWYEFKASASGEETELLLYGEIGGWGNTAEAFAADLKKVPKNHRINLRIYSPGGDVFAGNVIFGALGRHPGGVTTHIDGLAASMASVIALAGSPVKMANNALYMIHNITGSTWGDADDMRKTADLLDKVQETIVDTYVRKTKKPKMEIEAMMDEETWMTAIEAKEAGFIDEITEEVKMAAVFDFSKFKHPPVDTGASPTRSNQSQKAMLIETPEYLALKAEHQKLGETHKTLTQDLAALTEANKTLSAKLGEAEKLAADTKTALEKLTADAAKAAADHKAELETFNDKVGKAAAKLIGELGTTAVKLGTDPGMSASGKELVAQLDAIKDPIERTRFYRANKQAIDAAYRA